MEASTDGQAQMMQLAQVQAMQDQYMKLQESCEKYAVFLNIRACPKNEFI